MLEGDRVARSSLAPAAMTSKSKDRQSENDAPRRRKIGSISAQPKPPMTPPNKVTDSSWDHIAMRGPASPWWSAVSAWRSRGSVVARKASV